MFGILKRDLSELIRKNRSKWLSGVQLSGCCTVLNLLVMEICALNLGFMRGWCRLPLEILCLTEGCVLFMLCGIGEDFDNR